MTPARMHSDVIVARPFIRPERVKMKMEVPGTSRSSDRAALEGFF